ncbi:MAG: protein phosphatase 2C domain-containing protein [Pseudomonadota bacterium]
MKFSIYQSSRQGGRRYNQDRVAYSYSKESLLMVVADGMGGHFHGEIAAQMTVQLVAEMFQKQAHPMLRDPLFFLDQAMHAVHEAISEYSAENELLESPRTTCVAAVIQRDMAYWAHVGDSRLYFFRKGRLVQRTQDHSRVQQLFEQGHITEAQMITHPERNKIYNCLGGMVSPEVELSRRTPIEPGDILMLCSDGLWGSLSVNEIGAILNTYPLDQAIPELMDHAEFRGGQDGDNLSAIAMTWGGQGSNQSAGRVSTEMMSLDSFTTQLDVLSVLRDAPGAAPVSDEDIEKAIAEIQAAIKKYSK